MKTSRNFWPYGILLFFVLFFAAMTTVVVIAVTHRDGLVSANYYEQELRFQTQIDGSARAIKSGASIAYDAGKNLVVVALPVAQIAQKCSGKIELYRPSASGLDREFVMEPKTDGTQAVDVSRFAAGLWVVRARWNVGGEDYFLEQKIRI